jgi:tRNA U34 5-carboxymethylaminomethyl modifying GTPase MnmE/TrmE
MMNLFSPETFCAEDTLEQKTFGGDIAWNGWLYRLVKLSFRVELSYFSPE